MRNLMLAGVLALAGVLLSGCFAQVDAVKTALADRGAHVADAALETSLWGICNAATIGSIRRKFGSSPEAWKAWRELCISDRQLEDPPPAVNQ